MESHKPATIRSDECVVRQGVTRGGASELRLDAADTEATSVTSAQ
jgi:hypothetical protein